MKNIVFIGEGTRGSVAEIGRALEETHSTSNIRAFTLHEALQPFNYDYRLAAEGSDVWTHGTGWRGLLPLSHGKITIGHVNVIAPTEPISRRARVDGTIRKVGSHLLADNHLDEDTAYPLQRHLKVLARNALQTSLHPLQSIANFNELRYMSAGALLLANKLQNTGFAYIQMESDEIYRPIDDIRPATIQRAGGQYLELEGGRDEIQLNPNNVIHRIQDIVGSNIYAAASHAF